MKTIWKFEVKVTDEARVRMPIGAQILPRVEAPNVDNLNIWAIVDDSQPMEWRYFRVVGTGHPFPDADDVAHIGTAVTPPFVWHLFGERAILGEARA